MLDAWEFARGNLQVGPCRGVWPWEPTSYCSPSTHTAWVPASNALQKEGRLKALGGQCPSFTCPSRSNHLERTMQITAVTPIETPISVLHAWATPNLRARTRERKSLFRIWPPKKVVFLLISLTATKRGRFKNGHNTGFCGEKTTKIYSQPTLCPSPPPAPPTSMLLRNAVMSEARMGAGFVSTSHTQL